MRERRMQDVCLFAHFDKDDKVDEYVRRYLGKIKDLQFSIIFISAAKLPDSEVERLRVDCSDVILRENTGLDFGSWSAGFTKHAATIQGRLLLANDSVYGPIGNLPSAFDRLTTAPADFYGFVESLEPTPHLQSWFLLFEPRVVQSAEFKSILCQPFSTMTKKEIIVNGEIGLSRRLVSAGFKYNAQYRPSRSGLAARVFPMNPTQVLWRELLFYERIPFLKVELLRDNPVSLEDQQTILSDIEAVDASLYHSIKEHLARSPPRNTTRRRLMDLDRRASRARSQLIRQGYRFWKGDRFVLEACNFLTLFALVAILHMWRALRSTRKFIALTRIDHDQVH